MPSTLDYWTAVCLFYCNYLHQSLSSVGPQEGQEKEEEEGQRKVKRFR